MVWITARAALDRDFQRRGANIVDLAADGLVRAKAAALTVGRADSQRDVELTASFWRSMQQMTGSAYRDWVTGSFRTQIASDVGIIPAHAERAMGVMFEQDDLDIYLPVSTGTAPPRTDQPGQGSTDDELILALMHSRIIAQQYKSANAAAQALATIANGGGTEESKAARLRKAYVAKFCGTV